MEASRRRPACRPSDAPVEASSRAAEQTSAAVSAVPATGRVLAVAALLLLLLTTGAVVQRLESGAHGKVREQLRAQTRDEAATEGAVVPSTRRDAVPVDKRSVRRRAAEVVLEGGDASLALKQDDFFMTSWYKGGEVVLSADRCDFRGEGFMCDIEFPEHRMVRDGLPSDATVLELGARFGSLSCEIAKKLGNSGRLVSVEPDHRCWADLAANVQSHNCAAHLLMGILATDRAELHYRNYASWTERANGFGPVTKDTVQQFRLEQIEATLGIHIDSLVIDCEGCVVSVLDEIGVRLTQIRFIQLEADRSTSDPTCKQGCVDYSAVMLQLETAGLSLVDKRNDCDRKWHGGPLGTACDVHVWHYVFRRLAPGEATPRLPGEDWNAEAATSSPEARNEAVTKLESDEVFMARSPPRAAAKTVADSCEGWEGVGFICGIEFPEHKLVRDHLSPNSTVIEFGARFGSTSCEIARKLQNSGRVVSVEPDPTVWSNLEANLRSHDCHVHVLRGVIGSRALRFRYSNYASRTENVDDATPQNDDRLVTVDNYHISELERALGFRVDVLLIDCEGCAQQMMDQIGPLLESQVNLVLLEADMGDDGGDCRENCMDYKKFIRTLEDAGLRMIDKRNDCDRSWHGAPEGTWCGDWIWHYAFKRIPLPPGWTSFFDAISAKPYYYNMETGETQWDTPAL